MKGKYWECQNQNQFMIKDGTYFHNPNANKHVCPYIRGYKTCTYIIQDPYRTCYQYKEHKNTCIYLSHRQ